MTSNDPIRMSDYQQRRRAVIAPSEAARQFKVSAGLALVMIAATALVAAGTVWTPSDTAQVPQPVEQAPQIIEVASAS